MVEAISNSGPLIHLAQIEKFELLNVFSKIYIPKEVFKEVCTAGKQGEKELKKAENVEILEVSGKNVGNIKKKVKGFKLDEGELQALCLCNKLKKIFLTDDWDAREASKTFGLEVHGSVGIITRAYREGLINFQRAEKALSDLYNVSSLFVTKTIIDEAIEELRKFAQG